MLLSLPLPRSCATNSNPPLQLAGCVYRPPLLTRWCQVLESLAPAFKAAALPVAAAAKTSEFLRRTSCLEGVEPEGEEAAAEQEEELAQLGRTKSSGGWVAAAITAEDIPPSAGAEPAAAAAEGEQDPAWFLGRDLADYDENLGSLQRKKGEAPNKEIWR